MRKQTTLYFPSCLKDSPLEDKYLASTIRLIQDTNHLDYSLPVHLHSGYLNNIIGKSYSKTIKRLANAGILEQEKSYVVGEHSRSYRLAPDLYHEDWMFRSYTNKDKMIGRLMDWRGDKFRRNKDELRGTSYYSIIKDLGRVQVRDIDLDDVEFPAKRKFKKTSEGYRWVDIDPEQTRLAAQMCLDKLRQKEFYCTRDDYGRLHYNLTALPSELRQFLMFACAGGVNLYSVDIRNSQPLFLGLFLLSFCPSLSFSFLSSTSPLCLEFSSSILPEVLNSKGLRAEIDVYQKWVELSSAKLAPSLDLYERIAGDTGTTREETKQNFFHSVYGPVSVKNNVTAWFRDTLPIIFNVLLRFKNANGYRELARMMQRLESSFMFNVLVPMIRANKQTILQTIHDSVICPEDDVALVQDCFVKAFEQIGIAGKVKTCGLTPRPPLLAQV